MLLVDDHKDGLAARKAVLEELGHTVTTAGNGQAAYDLLQQQAFDLLVTDFKMPKLNGLELIARLRAEGQTLPIVLLSGYSNVVDWKACGADDVLEKSSNELVHLVSAVGRLLARKPKRKPVKQAKVEDIQAESLPKVRRQTS
ncbi:MAG: hypothetical protein OHK0021_12500 [Bryobacter sp.]